MYPDEAKHNAQEPQCIVVIGANTGGPQALSELLPRFPASFPGAIIVMQKMRPGFSRVLVEQFSRVCKTPVCEPDDGQALHGSRIYIAPAASRLTIRNMKNPSVPGFGVFLEDIAQSTEVRSNPTDAAMESAAKAFGAKTIGVLLTGFGLDGRTGMEAISLAGGTTIAQDEATSIIHDLPRSAIEVSAVKEVLPLWSIAERIIAIAGGKSDAAAA